MFFICKKEGTILKNTLKKVLFLFGGKSCERDISVITGVLCSNSVDKTRYSPVPVYITEDGWFTGEKLCDPSFYKQRDTSGLKKVAVLPCSEALYDVTSGKLKKMFDVYCAVNCCHGMNGEDGTLAGLFKLCRIPFASPDVMASSVFMDKAAGKYYLAGANIPVLPFYSFTGERYFGNRELCAVLVEKKIGFPCIIKPANLGSSIGISIAKNREEFKISVERALRFDDKILIEPALKNFTEINCAAYAKNGKIIVSECENPKFNGEFLTFSDKYSSGLKNTVYREFPADIPDKTAAKIKELTLAIYKKSFITGVIRADFLVSEDGEVFVNEVNTVPGSLALYLFRDSPARYGEVLTDLIEEGVRANRAYLNRTFTFGSDVLSNTGAKSGAKSSVHT